MNQRNVSESITGTVKYAIASIASASGARKRSESRSDRIMTEAPATAAVGAESGVELPSAIGRPMWSGDLNTGVGNGL